MIGIIIATILAVVNAGNLIVPAPAPLLRNAQLAPAPIVTAAPLLAPAAKTVAVADADYDPNPQYSYAYDIQDALTGDAKNHYETRYGDAVQGSYSLVDADGTRRVVKYTADSLNGFNAVVHKEPLAIKAVAAPIAAPLAYAAPVPDRVAVATPVAKVAAPVLPAKAFLH